MVTGYLRSALLVNIQRLLQRSVVFEGLSVMTLIRSIVFVLCLMELVVSFRRWLECEVSLLYA